MLNFGEMPKNMKPSDNTVGEAPNVLQEKTTRRISNMGLEVENFKKQRRSPNNECKFIY